jgi:hypothetical protein
MAMRLLRVRFTARWLIVSIAAFAMLLLLEKLLFNAAVWALTSPLPTEHVYLGDAVLLWVLLNGAAVVVLGPIICAMKMTDSFTSTPRGWASRLRRWARALVFGLAGTAIGAVLGFAVGMTYGIAVEPPGTSPHNSGLFGAFLVSVALAVLGAIAGAPVGFVVGLVRLSRRSRPKPAHVKGDVDLA